MARTARHGKGFRFNPTRSSLVIVGLSLVVAVASLAANFLLGYQQRLRQTDQAFARVVEGQLSADLARALESNGDEGLDSRRLGGIVAESIPLPELTPIAVMRDADGRIVSRVNTSAAALREIASVPTEGRYARVETADHVLFPFWLSGGAKQVVVGFSKREAALPVAAITGYTAAFVVFALVLYFFGVFRHLRHHFHQPLREFIDTNLGGNINAITAGRRQAFSEQGLEFLPPELRESVNNSMEALNIWANHKYNLDRFIALSILEVDKEELARNLRRFVGSELPIRQLTLMEVNHSLNQLRPLYATHEEPCQVEILHEPRQCFVYRSNSRLIQTAEQTLCSVCPREEHEAMLCKPLVAGSQEIGVCKVVIDERELQERWRFVAEPGEKLNLADAFLSTYVDLTSLSLSSLKLMESYKNQAITDPLTGIYNRRYIIEHLSGLLNLSKRTENPLSVFMIDVDHFKRLNDEYGHKTGDMVLRQLAETMSAALRESDVIGRYGGEEFIVVLPHTDSTAAAEVAERIRASVAEIDWSDLQQENLPRVTISIGVAEFPLHGYSHYHLSNAADKALYRAKRAGRNRVEIHRHLPEADAPPPTEGR